VVLFDGGSVKALSATWVHLIIGLATIGSVAGLAAGHVVNGTDALTIITGLSGVLLGTSSVSMGSAAGVTAAMTMPPQLTQQPTPVVTPPPVA